MGMELTTTGAAALILSTQQPLEQNPAAVYLASLRSGPSRATMRAALDTIAALVSGGRADALSLDWSRLRFQHTAAIASKLGDNYAPATANKMLCALRRTLGVAYDLGQMDAESYRRAIRVKGPRGERLPAGRGLTSGELVALFAACGQDTTPAGVRDAAALALLRLGLRRQEVAGLQLADLDLEGETVKVHGKGGKERLVPLTGGATEALTDWQALRDDQPGPLLYQINKGGRVVASGITPQAVYNLLAKRAQQAGVKEVSPHDLRRSFVGDLLDAGADLSVVQKLAGHADPKTTARYDRRPERAKRRAVDLLHVPYIGRRTLPGMGQ